MLEVTGSTSLEDSRGFLLLRFRNVMLKYCIMTLEEEAEASMSISFLNAGHMLCDCVCDVFVFYTCECELL